MIDRFSAWFPLLLLAMLAAFTFWLDRFVQPPAPGRNPLTRHDPDYIVDQLSATRMAASGSIENTLFAEKMTHYPDDDSTYLVSPRFVSYAMMRAPVTITSREAVVSSEGENIYFRNDVHVVRAPYADKSELVMLTNYLHVIPDRHIAQTDQPVTITDANTVIHAVGLELNSETRILKLFSRVRGTYHEPNKPARGGSGS